MKSLRVLFIIEAIILLLLAATLFTSRQAFIPAVLIALLFSVLAGFMRDRNPFLTRAFGIIALFGWLFTLVLVITTGYFWLLLIWPVLWGVFFFRREQKRMWDYENQGSEAKSFQGFEEAGRKDVTDTANDVFEAKEEILDLETLDFKNSPIQLEIDQQQCRLEILVPSNVGFSLRIEKSEGIVYLFDEPAFIEEKNISYESPGYARMEKQVKIHLKFKLGRIRVLKK